MDSISIKGALAVRGVLSMIKLKIYYVILIILVSVNRKIDKGILETFHNMRHIVYHNPPSYPHFFFGNIYVNYIPRHASWQKKNEDEPCRHC